MGTSLALTTAGCVDGSPALDGGSSTGESTSSGGVVAENDVTGLPPPPDTTGGPVTGPAVTTILPGTSDSGTTSGSCEGGCPVAPLDVVFVIDNSSSMGPSQRRLAVAAEALWDELMALQDAHEIVLDLNLMVTTSDMGNPLCSPFRPAGYSPAQGAPVDVPCADRLEQFTGLTGSPVQPEVCTDVCPVAVHPDDPFIHVEGLDDNVSAGTPLNALQCLLPQGLVGCGFESTLEAMLQSLNPTAAWNQLPSPAIRDGANLLIVLLTDEMDCSVQDFALMENSMFHNINPDTGMTAATSALCWNAGVACDGPDGSGIYSNCTTDVDNGLFPTARYTSYLVDQLVGSQNKEVMMLTLTGVPQATAHATRPPYQPTAGGVDDLVYRDWRDGEFPVGDIVPDEFVMGVTAADKTFRLGIGPGCTGADMAGEFTQAIPPSRIRAVCEALDAQGGTHCCMESICGEEYGEAMHCMRGLIEQSLPG